MLSHFDIDTQRLLAALPARQLQAVYLVYAQDCSETEAAARMGCTRSTVHGYLTEARATLRSKIEARPARNRRAPLLYG